MMNEKEKICFSGKGKRQQQEEIFVSGTFNRSVIHHFSSLPASSLIKHLPVFSPIPRSSESREKVFSVASFEFRRNIEKKIIFLTSCDGNANEGFIHSKFLASILVIILA